MAKKEWNQYLAEATENKGKVILSEGAKELASKAQAYLKKKEQEEKSLDGYVKALKDLADDDFNELTADDLIMPVMACDDLEQLADFHEPITKAFDNLINAMAMIQSIAGDMADKLEKGKAEKALDKPSK
jgi:Na+/phosphate symporter